MEQLENEKTIGTHGDLTKKRTGKKVWSVIFDIFTVLVVLFVIFLMILMLQMKGLTTNGISLGGYRMFLVQTMSMTPMYPSGSVVITKAVPPDELNIGDAISFRVGYSNAVVTHRIVEIEKNFANFYEFTTKGDANEVNDSSKVESSDVLGVVIFGIPNVGSLLNWLRSIWGLILLVILPAGLVIIGESIRLTGMVKEEKQKKKDRENEQREDAQDAGEDTGQEVDAVNTNGDFSQEGDTDKPDRDSDQGYALREIDASSDLESAAISLENGLESPGSYEVVSPLSEDKPINS